MFPIWRVVVALWDGPSVCVAFGLARVFLLAVQSLESGRRDTAVEMIRNVIKIQLTGYLHYELSYLLFIQFISDRNSWTFNLNAETIHQILFRLSIRIFTFSFLDKHQYKIQVLFTAAIGFYFCTNHNIWISKYIFGYTFRHIYV